VGLKRLLILGATGNTGRLCVTQGLERGYSVTAFARNRAKVTIEHQDLRIVEGDLTNPADVRIALAGQDAVISTFSGNTPTRRFPELVGALGSVVGEMQKSAPRRLIYLSFLGVKAGKHQLSWIGREIVSRFILHNVVADHEAKEAIIIGSTLDWTIVRAPRLTNGPRTGQFRAGEDIRATAIVPTISRADLASFLLDQVESHGYLRRTPAIMK
jgi:putative NADH-flavin reductase